VRVEERARTGFVCLDEITCLFPLCALLLLGIGFLLASSTLLAAHRLPHQITLLQKSFCVDGVAMFFKSKVKQGKFKTSTGEVLLRWYCYSASSHCIAIWAKTKSAAQDECQNRGMHAVKIEPAPPMSSFK
jgi:hypothetical protein